MKELIHYLTQPGNEAAAIYVLVMSWLTCVVIGMIIVLTVFKINQYRCKTPSHDNPDHIPTDDYLRIHRGKSIHPMG